MTSYQPDPAPAPAVPARLGRYQLVGRLATGGMGEIHLARLDGDGGFEKLVVVKRLLPELVASPQYVAMFLDEARLVARLSHPNICEVFEVGRDGHEYFLAMPYLEGVSLADLLGRPRDHDRPRHLRFVAGLVAQAAEGLHHAHELRGKDGEPLGLVHRDVSPSNLFATTAGVVKVLDFGIAKVRGATARTEVGTIKGKYAYMSPEQVRGDDLDRRSDVFALGIVLFELVTHQRLFKRPSDYLSAKGILEEAIPRADAVDPAVPRPLADAIARALERERDARFATARELGAAVAAATPGGPMAPAELAEVLAQDHQSELSEQRTRQQRALAAHGGATASTVSLGPKRPRRGLALGLAALALAGTTALAVWQLQPPSASVPDAAPAPVAAAVADAAPPSDAAAAADPAADPAADAAADPDPDPAPAPARRGRVSIDSTPYATIYLGQKKLGVTPLIGLAMPAGRHRLRAVLEDGREQSFNVVVPAGKLARPVNLSW
jgi:serine/threonine-protein kinase